MEHHSQINAPGANALSGKTTAGVGDSANGVRTGGGASSVQSCIHIGLPKTATKALQINLFSKHPGLAYLGTYHSAPYLPFGKCRDAATMRLMDQLIWKRTGSPDIPACRDLFEQVLGRGAEQGAAQGSGGGARAGVPLWSWEALSLHRRERRRERAMRLRQVFGPSKIIITLRHPVSLVESVYFQVTKRNNIEDGAYWGRGPWYRPIMDWLETGLRRKRHNVPANHIDYAETIRIYADVFGVEAIHIMLFEQLLEDTDAFVTKLCGILGVAPPQEVGLTMPMEDRANIRWTSVQMQRLEEIRNSPGASIKFRFASRVKRRQMLGIEDADSRGDGESAPKAQVELSDRWVKRIAELTRSGNRYLTETWGLPLERYDYPV